MPEHVTITLPGWLLLVPLVYLGLGVLVVPPLTALAGGYIHPYQSPRRQLRELRRARFLLAIACWPAVAWDIASMTRRHGWRPSAPGRRAAQ